MIVLSLSFIKVEIGEYGVHWNFFMTLGSLPLLLYLATKATQSPTKLCILACGLLSVYELLLHLGLQSILLTAPRTNLITQNKEGLSSLLGYFCTFLFSIKIGETIRQKETSFIQLLPLLTIVMNLLNSFLPCSRRFSNSVYVFWILTSNTWMLYGFSKLTRGVPMMLNAINRNQLATFMIVLYLCF